MATAAQLDAGPLVTGSGPRADPKPELVMSTSPEANPSTDSRPSDSDGDISTSVEPAADDQASDHPWPDAGWQNPRTIDAGPDFEIFADSTPSPDSVARIGRIGEDVPKPPEPRPDPELQQDLRAETVGPSGSQTTDGQVVGGGIAVRFRATTNLLLARIDDREAVAHLIEHRRTTLWIWRRLVGASFAYILISLAWYLVKLPSSLLADTTLPTQVQVAGAFHELRIDGLAGATLASHAGSSLFRFATGLGVGALVGVSVGLISGSAPLVRTIIDPVVSMFRMVPGLAAGPLLLVWFGLGEAGLIAVVAFSVFWVTAAASADGRIGLVRRRPLPPGAVGTDPAVDVVLSGLRAAVLIAWTTMLTIETVASSTGLGAMIWFAQGRSDMVLAGILVVGVIGFAIDTSLRATHYLLTQSF